MTDPIPATTSYGTGLVLPIAKTMNHIMTVHTALTREWPLSAGDAQVELQDAQNHLQGMTLQPALMTEETHDAIIAWRGQLNDRIQGMTNITDETPLADAITPAQLQDLARDTWQLLTLLDQELTGLAPFQADPGNLP